MNSTQDSSLDRVRRLLFGGFKMWMSILVFGFGAWLKIVPVSVLEYAFYAGVLLSVFMVVICERDWRRYKKTQKESK